MRPDPLTWWQSHFSGVAPRGHLLRHALSQQWVRFHSLPESKRYAESVDDYIELQKRHLAVASSLFSVGEPLYVFRAYGGETRLRGKQRHQLAGRQFREAVAHLPVENATLNDDEDRMYVRALISKWKPDFFEAAVRLLADWQEVGVSVVSPATRNIFCPYDGGMDVFAFSIGPEELRARFPSWLSSMPSGL